MVQLQPQAVGTPRNPTGWCGTESGHPSHDVSIDVHDRNLVWLALDGESLWVGWQQVSVEPGASKARVGAKRY